MKYTQPPENQAVLFFQINLFKIPYIVAYKCRNINLKPLSLCCIDCFSFFAVG
jgi:hypothetical protein